MKAALYIGGALLIVLLSFGGYETVNTMSNLPYLETVRSVKRKYGIDVPDGLILAVMETESSFDPMAYRAEEAINDASIGLMQTLLGTARQMGYRGEEDGLYDPETSIRFGAKYLAYLFNRYHDWDAVIHAYNEGPGNYDKGKRVYGYYAKVKARWNKWDALILSEGQ